MRATGGRNTYDSSPDFELIFISQFLIFQKDNKQLQSEKTKRRTSGWLQQTIQQQLGLEYYTW